MRRRGVVVLNEEDIWRLLKLNPGERVTGVLPDSIRDSILIRIEGGDELPECAEGMYPATVERPFAMVDLRRRLLLLLAHDSESLADDVRELLREELLW